MKFSDQTLKLMKSFSSINQSMLFRQGKFMTISSPNKTMVARAETDDEFDREFAIYDLSKFLSVLSLFDMPDIVFQDNRIVISRGKASVHYITAVASTIVVPPADGLNVVKVHGQFNLSKDDYSAIQKVVSVLGSPDIQIVAEGGKMILKTTSKKNSSAENFVSEVGETDASFVASFKAENLKMIPGDYTVQIGEVATKREGITVPVIYFNGTPNDKLTQYWVTVEADDSRF